AKLRGMARALIALGSNLGDRQAALEAAAKAVGSLPDSQLLARSSWLESAAVGGPQEQPEFLNGALLLATALEPLMLLDHLQQIENAAGRVRSVHWGPRTLDLDLLLHDDRSIATERLTLPHPRMAFRRFVLEPAAQIAAEMVHPATGMTVGQLLAHLNATPQYLAIVGPPHSGKTRLARKIARQSGGRLLLDADAENVSPGLQDSAGRELAREIEFLARRAHLLASCHDHQTWTVSDFWLPQSVAWAEATGGEPLRLQVEAACQKVCMACVQPRFVAVLDVSPAAAEDPVGGDFETRLRAAMRRLVSQHGPPPVWLSGDDWDHAVAELLAVLAG
ncbi:MAG: 2-amino-4-hydroxy-6-hydroxymethyldihydropteridine diphosphokinase, partial [Pirellulales bacterium]